MYLISSNQDDIWYIEETEIPYLFEGEKEDTFTYIVIGQCASQLKRKPR
jgi:hypothetical protein